MERWQIVFYIAAGLMFAGNTLYIFLAQTDEVPWNRPPAGIEGSAEPEEESEEEEEIALLPKPDSPPPRPHPHRRRSTLRRESQAFIPPFNPPGARGRRPSTLSLGFPHQN